MNTASLTATITPLNQRSRDIWEILDCVEADANGAILGIRRMANNLCVHGSPREEGF